MKQLRSFLGTCSYYRQCVYRFSTIAAPLFELTKKGTTFVWNDRAETAFNTLKDKLCSTPILALPRDDAETIFDVDACDTGIAAVLSQMHDSVEKVVAYASRTLNDAEKYYSLLHYSTRSIGTYLWVDSIPSISHWSTNTSSHG